MTSRALRAVAIAILLCPGCRGAESGRTHGDGKEPQQLVPTAAPSMGCAECVGEGLLSAIGVALASDGSVFVLNEHEPFVRLFGPAGALVRAMGERGEGPGQLGTPARIYADNEDVLIVHDYAPPRFVRFSIDGAFLGTTPHPPTVPTSTTLDRSSDVICMMIFELSNREPRVQSVPLDGSEPSIALAGGELPKGPADDVATAAQFAVASSPDGELAVANVLTYRIRVYGRKADLVAEFGRDLPRPVKSGAELREERGLRSRLGRGEPDPQKQHFGSFGMRYDDRGQLWILSERGERTAAVFDVFGADGTFLGSRSIQAEVLRRTQAFDVRGGILAAIVLDATGNTRVRTWRVDVE